jgi:hypothetical protein
VTCVHVGVLPPTHNWAKKSVKLSGQKEASPYSILILCVNPLVPLPAFTGAVCEPSLVSSLGSRESNNKKISQLLRPVYGTLVNWPTTLCLAGLR